MLSSVVYKLINSSNYNFSYKDIDFHMQTHPDYPSFKSISDTCDYFGIENVVAEIPKENFNDLPSVFITLMNNETVFVKKGKNKLQTINADGLSKKMTYKSFIESWNPIIIAVEPDEKQTINSLFGKVEHVLIPLITILLLALYFSKGFALISTIYYFLNIVGLYFGYLILQESLGNNNEVATKVCSALTKKEGCNAVLNTSQAKITSYLNLSDLVLIYFSANILFCSLYGFNQVLFSITAILSIPVIIYTVFSQAFVLKKWCALCLLVSSILLLQFLLLLFSYSGFNFSYQSYLEFSFIILGISALWIFIKNKITENKMLEQEKQEYYKFKRNAKMFLAALKENPINAPYEKEDVIKISFGNLNSNVVIDAVTNPLCGFCSKAFIDYYQLLQTDSNIKLNIIFTSFKTNKEDKGMQIITSIIDLYLNNKEQEAWQALYEWYKEKDFEKWIKKHGTEGNMFLNSKVYQIIEKNQQWMQENEVNYTPATIVQNHKFPEQYNSKDIPFFTEELNEISQNTLASVV